MRGTWSSEGGAGRPSTVKCFAHSASATGSAVVASAARMPSCVRTLLEQCDESRRSLTERATTTNLQRDRVPQNPGGSGFREVHTVAARSLTRVPGGRRLRIHLIAPPPSWRRPTLPHPSCVAFSDQHVHPPQAHGRIRSAL